MSDLPFDFGFNAVSLDELNLFQEQQQNLEETEATAQAATEQLAALRAAIQPLLNNLKKDPNKDYILWQNRVPKIEEFERHLDNIVSKG
jgi:cell division protein FtsB